MTKRKFRCRIAWSISQTYPQTSSYPPPQGVKCHCLSANGQFQLQSCGKNNSIYNIFSYISVAFSYFTIKLRQLKDLQPLNINQQTWKGYKIYQLLNLQYTEYSIMQSYLTCWRKQYVFCVMYILLNKQSTTLSALVFYFNLALCIYCMFHTYFQDEIIDALTINHVFVFYS